MKRSLFESPSLGRSVIAAATIGIIVGSVAVILDATWTQHATSWYVRALVVGSLQLCLVTLLVSAVLEQRRKQTIRRTLEFAFLNHHIRNALVQVQFAESVADHQRQRRLLDEAVERVSESLYRVTRNKASKVSLDRDLGGSDLVVRGRDHEQREGS
ncbi:MAG TPA: hypothetical protein VET69_06460 [Terriglobales bacterium]|nr:hypothetical protein [Terriglobales bacterium]